MSEISREAIQAAARAIAQVWTSENKNADRQQASILFEPSAEAALIAALPYLVAQRPKPPQAGPPT
jgi:hypothetical protein